MDKQYEYRQAIGSGTGLALLGIFLPYVWHEMPTLISYPAILMGIALIGWGVWPIFSKKYHANPQAQITKNPEVNIIDFISLDEALTGIADKSQVPKFIADRSEAAEMWRYSDAAARLHKCLHNAPEQRPQWVEQHKITRQHLRNDAVSNEGMEILEHMAGWYLRQSKERSDHILFCIKVGLDSDIEPMKTDPNSGKWNWKNHPFQREKQIGFDRVQLIGFLDNSEIEHGIKT
ncbi:MAG: Uncharacterized protein AWT59_2210 [Candidatus Gallionella acididurans]|uniref:Uncharacterized protein n=1 Tax=Candidatus Gallionella acididurans TaxID=1796491 RepID=A0A139BRQ4_9PROT|nr:MAG: Uncharacterized protein AWT59_2210 [Candidatus Gallionella acididurans]